MPAPQRADKGDGRVAAGGAARGDPDAAVPAVLEVVDALDCAAAGCGGAGTVSGVYHGLPTASVGDWAEAAGALFTALAAGAALLTARQGHRTMRAAVEPDVHLQVLGDVKHNRTQLVIANTGGGTTKGTAYQVAAGGMRAMGWLGDGFLAPGDKVVILPELPVDDDAEAQVLYRAADESSWVVTRDGRKRCLRKGREGGATPGDEAWKTMHPDVAWEGLPQVAKLVQWVEKRGVIVGKNPVT